MFPITIFTWSLLKDWVKTNKKTILVILVVSILLILNIRQCNNNQGIKKKLEVAEHNIQALNDSIRISKDKEGKTEYNKYSLLVDKVNNLEKLNKELFTEVKNIKGRTSTIIKSDIKIIHDTLSLPVKSEIKDSVIITSFNFDTVYNPGNYRRIKGFTEYNLKTNISTGSLENDEIGVSLVTGIKNLDKGKPEIFLKSDYPGFIPIRLDGAVLDPGLFKTKKRKLLTVGLNVGWIPIIYDIKQRKFDVSTDKIGVSAGVNINLIKLLTNK